MANRKVSLDCALLQAPGLATIDRLARLQLLVRRQGCGLELVAAQPRLLELILFAGLAAALGVESGRQAEEGEQPLSVEEESEL